MKTRFENHDKDSIDGGQLLAATVRSAAPGGINMLAHRNDSHLSCDNMYDNTLQLITGRFGPVLLAFPTFIALSPSLPVRPARLRNIKNYNLCKARGMSKGQGSIARRSQMQDKEIQNKVGLLGGESKRNSREKNYIINDPPPLQYVSVLIKAPGGQDLIVHVTPEYGQSLDELREAVLEGLTHCGLAKGADGVWTVDFVEPDYGTSEKYTEERCKPFPTTEVTI